MSPPGSFSRFLVPGRLHFAAHSHHPWPDVSFAAHQQAWLDAARLIDDKWDHVFAAVWPEAQAHVATELGLADPATVAFAPSTHELVLRLLSLLPATGGTVVSSDSEFHSFERQTRRLEEDGRLTVIRVPQGPVASFAERLVETARRVRPHLVFVSQVFFNSGAELLDVEALVAALPADALVAIDAYHGFMAVPTRWGSALQERAFYIAGGYKYAMAGEGVCFAHVPPSAPSRPLNTGWFASFGSLAGPRPEQVAYGPGGQRFVGATFDPSGLYRFNAVMRWRAEHGLTTARVQAHVAGLKRSFVQRLPAGPLREEDLLVPADGSRAHFLTFVTPRAAEVVDALKARGVDTDSRVDRLRIGLGLYHADADLDALAGHLAAIG